MSTRKIEGDPGVRRIAFVQVEPFPISNRFVAEQLRCTFPEYQVDVFNVLDLLRSAPTRFGRAGVEALRVYGLDIALRRRRPRASFVHTSYFFHQARRLVLERVRQAPYAFTFQMQSLFDVSTGQVPHFLYTDHTNLANLHYDHTSRFAVYPDRWRRLETAIYRNATVLFVRSRHVERSLVEDYGIAPERIECVYAGSNAGATTLVADGSETDRPVGKRILFVGMDWERKGGPVLMRAFRRVRDAHPDAELVVVGKSPAIDEPNVKVVGQLPVERIADEYRRAAVLCVPTLREPFGVVFVEAMNHGVPIVSTTVGALPDMVEDGVNGFLVPPGDADALADRLVTLLGDPGLAAAMAIRSKALANDRYNWDAVGRRMATRIRAVLAGADAGPDVEA